MNYHILTEELKIQNAVDGIVNIIPPNDTVEVDLAAPSESGTIALTSDLDGKANLVDGVVPIIELPPGFQPEILSGTYINETTFNDLDDNPYVLNADKLYIDSVTRVYYRWDGAGLGAPPTSLALGETSASAHRGDHGAAAYAHTALTNNPHGVTKAQVGLSNVDNTADVNKPVSSLTQTALDLKLDKQIEINTYTTNRTLTTDDAYHLVIMDSVSDLEVTIPPDVFSGRVRIDVARYNDGEVSFVSGLGVTLRSADDAVHLRVKNSVASAVQISPNNWLLLGNLKILE